MNTSLQRVGWVGTGVMGSAMCEHLLAAGHSVAVFNRTRARAEALLAAGATWGSSPAAVAAEADVTFTMVGYPSDVREVMLGADGVLAGARPGSVVVDLTTSDPSLAREIHETAQPQIEVLDAPVSGGDVGARNATLVVMVGGSAEGFDRVLPLFQTFGKTIVHQGGPGAGQHTKMVNQIAISSGMVGMCEALLYAYRSGLDVARALETISGGAAGSWSLTNYAPRILRGDYAPGFKVDHFVKDLGIALSEAERMNLSLPGLALAHQLYVAVKAQGHGQLGTHSLMMALATLSAVDPELKIDASSASA
jgi:3-hydroxyisobutyrate dehydrogenase